MWYVMIIINVLILLVYAWLFQLIPLALRQLLSMYLIKMFVWH